MIQIETVKEMLKAVERNLHRLSLEDLQMLIMQAEFEIEYRQGLVDEEKN